MYCLALQHNTAAVTTKRLNPLHTVTESEKYFGQLKWLLNLNGRGPNLKPPNSSAFEETGSACLIYPTCLYNTNQTPLSLTSIHST